MMIDRQELDRALRIIHDGELFEVRVVGSRDTYSGYFEDPDVCIDQLQRLNDNSANVYLTLNRLNQSLYNRQQRDVLMKTRTTTSDNDVISFKYLLIDLDPVRPAGIGSTYEQVGEAHVMAQRIYKVLKELGFEDPIAAMSGNGWHLLYRISLECTDVNRELIKDCLRALDMMFSTDEVKVDTTVFNPARICKLYGTYSRKGANTAETPHRLAKIVNEGSKTITDVQTLRSLAASAPSAPDRKQRRMSEDFDLSQWLSEHNVPVKAVEHSGGVTRHILECCPFNPDHKGKDAAVFELADGSLGFKCFHNSCSDKHWREFRLHYEPDAYTKDEPDTSLKPNHSSVTYSTAGIEAAFEVTRASSSAPIFYTLTDILDLPKQPEEYITTGIRELDSSLGGLKKGLVTCVSGLRGSGKSSLLSQVVLYAAVKEGAKCAMFSGELTARTSADWIFRQAAGIRGVEKFSRFSDKYFVPEDIKHRIAEAISDKIYIYNNDYGNNYESICKELIKCVKDKQVDLILLDNLMSLDIRSFDLQDKYRAQSLFVEQLETFAKAANIHIIFVAHPRKAQGFLRLDDISGSGDIINRVDNAVIIHRRNNDFLRLSRQMFGWNNDHALYKDGIGNVLEICKDRENGTQDKFIPLWFESSTKRLKNTPEEDVELFPEIFGEPF